MTSGTGAAYTAGAYFGESEAIVDDVVLARRALAEAEDNVSRLEQSVAKTEGHLEGFRNALAEARDAVEQATEALSDAQNGGQG